ncbi:MAG: glycosyltransferase [Anaerolineae bacterium]|nr:glycosyltransferase [Anaerolineae bacterium]
MALFLPSLRGGGVERVFVQLARGLADLDSRVDLVTSTHGGRYLDEIDRRVRLIDLGFRHVSGALPGLVRYLRQEKPDAVVSAMTHANSLAIAARFLAGSPARVIVSEHHFFSREKNRGFLNKERLVMALAGWLYPRADAITAVSQGVADDLSQSLRLPGERVHTIYNPIDIERIRALSEAPPEHPWFAPGEPPVILSAGRFTWEKDYPTLIQAFRKVHAERPARLVILGEGPDRLALEALIASLGLTAVVALPGFVANPYSFMRRCGAFALSSVTEGLPVALVEALACGARVVATNCPSGPAEILENGTYGRLVPVGDSDGMAAALLHALAQPADRQAGIQRAADFSLEKISRQYLDLIRSLPGMRAGE